MNIKCHGAFKGRKCLLLFATGDLTAINLGKKDGIKCMRGKFGRNIIKFLIFFRKEVHFVTLQCGTLIYFTGNKM